MTLTEPRPGDATALAVHRGPVTPVPVTEAVVAALDLPDPHDPRQAPLHAATARAREVAVATLEAGFPTLPLRRSTQATDATTLAVGAADPALVAALDGEGLLAGAFQTMAFRAGVQLKLVRDREHRDLGDVFVTSPDAYPGGRSRARAATVAAALDEGFTVVLDGIEMRTPASMHLAALFERAFGCVININGYLSTARQHSSFGAHWDDQEVVILQLIGHKDWTIESPAALSMNKAAHGDAVSGTTVWEGRIGPGDALYVPRGWGHIVNSLDELTFHYTITIPRFNGLHALDGVLASLADDAGTAAGAGRSGAGIGRPLPLEPAAVDPSLDLLAEDPARVDRLVRRAVARNRFGFARRPTGSLRRQLDALTADDLTGVPVLCPCPGGWLAVDPALGVPDAPDGRPGGTDGSGGDAVLAGIANQVLRIPVAHLDAVGTLTDGRVHDAGSADPDLVRSLVRLGALDVVADPGAWGLTWA